MATVLATAPLITPDRVSPWVPPVSTLPGAPSATVPDNDAPALPLLLVSVPPFSVTPSAPTARPFRSSVAPEATTVPPAVVPSADALPSCSVPPLTLVIPV